MKACCVVAAGGAASIPPIVAGLNFMSDPIRRVQQSVSDFLKVTSLSALPEDGQPRKFAIIADRTDAWNRSPHVPIGAVYLRRTSPNHIEALNVICPHAGCAVDFQKEKGSYLCPCHNSSFAVDGAILDKSSPSARPLDTLEVEIRNTNEVWVKFMNFRAGSLEKTPLA